MISIAIDGPSGAGKSSLAKRLAAELGYVYVDTGAMYRAIGLYTLRAGQNTKDAAAVAALLPDIHLDIRPGQGAQQILLNGEDVTETVRQEQVGMAASDVSAHPAVRAFLLETQRALAARSNVLMDGRDIGTVVLPDATVKIFLTATPEARAQRRLAELQAKGQAADYATVLADIRLRDDQDTHRAVAPAAPGRGRRAAGHQRHRPGGKLRAAEKDGARAHCVNAGLAWRGTEKTKEKVQTSWFFTGSSCRSSGFLSTSSGASRSSASTKSRGTAPSCWRPTTSPTLTRSLCWA